MTISCCTNSSLAETKSDDSDKSKDDGGTKWWTICAASFLIQFVVLGMQNCSGVVFAKLIEEYNATRGATALVTSLAQSSSYGFGLVAAVICKSYGCRTVTLCAAIICGTGLLLSSFATSVFVLYFTYGILWGFGSCLVYFTSIISISMSCQKRLALANGIAASGCAIGMLAQGPAIQLLFQLIGWAHTMRVLALVQLVLITLGGLAYGPSIASAECGKTGKRDKGVIQTFFDWKLFKNRRLRIWIIAISFFVFALLIPYTHMVKFAEDIGASKKQASYLLIYMAISTIFSRPLIGSLADCKRCNRIHTLQFAFLLLGVSTTIVTIATHYYWIAVYLVIFGFVEGCFVTIMPVITSDIVGSDNLQSAFGGMMFFLSIFMATGPPFAGWIFDVSKDYSLAFFVAGGSTVLSVCIMFMISCPSKDNKILINEKGIKIQKVVSSIEFVSLLDEDIITERLTSV